MERHYPDILLTGYSEDIDAARVELGAYPGRVHQAGELTTELCEDWKGAIVGYLFSLDTRHSSQLKSLFVFLHDRLTPSREVAVFMRGVRPDDEIFPELEEVFRVTVDGLGDHLREERPG